MIYIILTFCSGNLCRGSADVVNVATVDVCFCVFFTFGTYINSSIILTLKCEKIKV